jgi:hypothetical protein
LDKCIENLPLKKKVEVNQAYEKFDQMSRKRRLMSIKEGIRSNKPNQTIHDEELPQANLTVFAKEENRRNAESLRHEEADLKTMLRSLQPDVCENSKNKLLATTSAYQRD